MTLRWELPNGAVTGFVIERRNSGGDFEQVASLGATATNYLDIIAHTNASDYRIHATYTGGDSDFSDIAGLNVRPELAMDGIWGQGASNRLYLAIPAFAEGVTAIRVNLSTWNGAGYSFQSSVSVGTNAFTNGIHIFSNSEIPPFVRYQLIFAAVDGAGNAAPASEPFELEYVPYIDNRQHLHDKSIYLARARDTGLISSSHTFKVWGGCVDYNFHFVLEFDPDYIIYPDHDLIFSNYVVSSYFGLTENFDYSADPLKPFSDAYAWYMFVYRTNPPLGDFNYSFLSSPFDRAAYLQSQGGTVPRLLAPSTATLIYRGWVASISTTTNAHAPCAPSSISNTTWGMSQNVQGQHLASSFNNDLGLSYISWKSIDVQSGQERSANPGQTLSLPQYGSYWYQQVDTPGLHHEEFYFGLPVVPGNTYDIGMVPGNESFNASTSEPPILIAPLGQTTIVGAWSKWSITNGYSGKYAYIQEHFDKAYKADANGNATTNETGILSEYGEFFPTEPGRVILTTKPDITTGAVGTGVVNVVHLGVDANHDGTMDRTFTGPDTTSAARPFRFWVNNDSDVGGADLAASSPANHLDNRINGERDSEDFARLWISGVPTLPAGYTATLSWVGSGAIKLYSMYESEGGIGYLTNATVANNQSFSTLNGSGVWTGFGAAIATNSASSSYEFPANTFSNNFRRHFLFEGVAAGQGELVLTIRNGGQTVATSSVHIELLDVKGMYERAYADNVTSGLPPSSLVSRHVVRQNLPAGRSAEKQMIVFVHGINNSEFDYENTSETMFKRLYWAGYRGQFAAFRWPCAYLPNNVVNNPAELLRLFNYNKGEFYAWKSAQAFKNYLTYLDTTPRLAGYSLNILAHSMGNVVASEAVKLGAPFDNYILSQGAVPAHCYDVNAPFLQTLLNAETSKPTPLQATNGGYHAYFAGVNGNLVNFFNPNDFALAKGSFDVPLFGTVQANWEENQRAQKPDSFGLGPRYAFYSSTNRSLASYYGPEGDLLYSRVVTDLHETKAMVARSRSRAVGAQSGLGAVIGSSVDLSVAPFGYGDTRPEHSAQFTRNLQTVRPYYQRILQTINPAP